MKKLLKLLLFDMSDPELKTWVAYAFMSFVFLMFVLEVGYITCEFPNLTDGPPLLTGCSFELIWHYFYIGSLLVLILPLMFYVFYRLCPIIRKHLTGKLNKLQENNCDQ